MSKNAPQSFGAVLRNPASLWTWESFGALRNVSALKIGYLGALAVPVFSYWVNYVNSFFPESKIELSLSLFLTFLGSVLLSLADLLNEIACPKIIKTHKNSSAYRKELAELVTDDEKIFNAGRIAEILRVVNYLRELYPDAEESALKKIAESIARRALEDLVTPTDNDVVVTGYLKNWDTANTSMPLIRGIILLLYGLVSLIVFWLAVTELRDVFNATFPAFSFSALLPS
ncbi:hypothetical protein D3C77_279480 [compost metagenome]